MSCKTDNVLVKKLERERRDTWPWVITFLDEETKEPLDFTGAVVTLYVKDTEGDPSDTPLFTSVSTPVGELTEGKRSFPITETNAALFGSKFYIIKSVTGTVITSLMKGPYQVN